jgi:predicted regulator of Ras-like GTPase activity (Roadblock/LC7/MglB family)
MTNPPTLTGTVLTALDTPGPPPRLTPYESMSWLLDDFVGRVPGVTHAMISSKDGLTLLASSLMSKDWANLLSAAVSGHASLAAGTPGPSGLTLPPKQILIEHSDHLLLIMVSGQADRAAFSHRPGTQQGMVETVLTVITTTEDETDAGVVGYQMGLLIKRFPQYMQTAARQELNGAPADSAHADIR